MLFRSLRLLQRCNNVPFVFVPWKGERSLWFWQMAAVVKPSKYGIAWFPLPFVRLFVLNRGGLQRCSCFVFVFSKANVRFPSRRRRSIFVFCFPKNRECSVTLPTCFQICCSIYASLKDTAYMGAWVSPFLCTITIVWWFLTFLGTWA